MALTISQKINVAKVSGYLAQNDLRKANNSAGTSIDPKLPRLLYMVRKAIEWKNTYDSTSSTLPFTSDYLLSLCGRYKDTANIIVNGGSGGLIITQQTSSAGGGGGSFTGNLFS